MLPFILSRFDIVYYSRPLIVTYNRFRCTVFYLLFFLTNINQHRLIIIIITYINLVNLIDIVLFRVTISLLDLFSMYT